MSATPEGEFTGLEVQDHVLLEEATKTDRPISEPEVYAGDFLGSYDVPHDCPSDCWARGYLVESSCLTVSSPISYTPSAASEQAERRASALYHPLKSRQTRVLRLEPGLFGQLLIAELMTADLIHLEDIVLKASEENVLFEVLSYS